MTEGPLASGLDLGSAEVLCELLALHGIPAWIAPSDALSLGLGARSEVEVPSDALRRAQSLLSAAPANDKEAWLLATGELDPAAARSAFSRGASAPRGASPVAAIAVLLGALLAHAVGAIAFLSR